jgi:hypothetical protein
VAQKQAVVRATLSATAAGTTDFSSTGFGTVAAAIIIVCNANATNNPQDVAVIGVGFWDGTNQRSVGFQCLDNQATTASDRLSDDSYGVSFPTGGVPDANHYSVSAITDGIRLTFGVDNTAVGRFCTVLLLGGVNAVAGTFTPNATQNSTQASASLGFAPGLVLFATIGATAADTNLTAAIISFGLASSDGTHRCILWGASDAVADEALTVKFATDRAVGQALAGTLTWAGEVTAFGADTFTMTTRDGGSGGDVCFFLALGGADLSYNLGTLTTPAATGSEIINTTITPQAALFALCGANNTTIATDAKANGLSFGMANATNNYSHNSYAEDGAGTTNSGSVATATDCIDLDSSAAGSRTDILNAAATLNPTNITLAYTITDGAVTPRLGWYLAFGAAAATGHPAAKRMGGVRFASHQQIGHRFGGVW